MQIDPSSDPFGVRSTSVYSDSLKDDARSATFIYLLSLFPHQQIQMIQHTKNSSAFLSSFRKDLKFVTEVEEEIKNLVELANKVR